MGSSRNPLRDNVSIPDKIIDAPALNPQAQVVGSPYKAPTAANVAAVPTTNTLMQLGNALSSVEPTLVQGVAYHQKNLNQKDVEAANQQWQETKDKLGDATRKGVIPPGQSQLFNDTWRSLDAKDIADQYQPALWQEWAQHPDATNPDKPNAFGEFRQKFRADWNQKYLRDPDNDHVKFTPHQLAMAKYDDLLDQADQHLSNHNAMVKVDQLTEKGKDTLNKHVQNTITQAMTNLDGSPRSPEQMDWMPAATKIKAATYGQTVGLVATGGLPPSVATETLATAVAQKVMDTGDISIAPRLGKALDSLDPAHPITGTQAWKSKLQVATEHATAQQQQTRRNQVFEADRLAQGGDDAINARTQQITAIADHEREEKWFTKADSNMILAPKDLTNPTPEESKTQGEAFNRLFKYNPEHAQFLQKQIRDLKEHVTDRIDKDRYSQNEVDIYQAIEKAPGSAGTADLIDQARKGNFIDGPTWQRLRQENKDMGMAAQQFKGVLDSPTYTNLEQGVKNSLIDPTKPFGEKSIAAAQAAHEFRQAAISELQQNPGMNASQLANIMQPKMKDFHLRYNDTAKALQAQRDEDQAVQDKIVQGMLTRDQANAIQKNDGRTFKNKNGETVTQTHEQTLQLLKAQEQTNAIDKEDKQALELPKEVKKYLSGPDPKKLGEYMTVPEKLELLKAVKSTYELGIHEKPTSQGVMRDKVRDILSKYYSNQHELNDATNHIIAMFTAKYEPKHSVKR